MSREVRAAGGLATPEVSVVVTFHREGILAHKTLRSIARCMDVAGMPCEVVCVLDRADDPTASVVSSFDDPRHVVVETQGGDAGAARNAGLERARGTYATIVDGDDYLSGNWIAEAASTLRSVGRETIALPHFVVSFGAFELFAEQIGQDDPLFDVDAMMTHNPWTCCCMGRRDTFLAHPYRDKTGTGFGYEDWNLYCDTLASGVHHRVVPDTALYYRRRLDGVLETEKGSRRLLGSSPLFAPTPREV